MNEKMHEKQPDNPPSKHPYLWYIVGTLGVFALMLIIAIFATKSDWVLK